MEEVVAVEPLERVEQREAASDVTCQRDRDRVD